MEEETADARPGGDRGGVVAASNLQRVIDSCLEISKHGTNKETVDKQVGVVDLKKREDATVVKTVAPVSGVP